MEINIIMLYFMMIVLSVIFELVFVVFNDLFSFSIFICNVVFI